MASTGTIANMIMGGITTAPTITTTIMVGIMTLLLGIFFFGLDQFFAMIVKFLLSLLG